MKPRIKDGWVRLEGAFGAAEVRTLADFGPIEKLSFTKAPRLTHTVARHLSGLTSVRQLWLWCDVTRGALKHVLAIPGLVTLDVLCLRGRGNPPSFRTARSLDTFRCPHGSTARDLLAISESRTLRELGVQNVTLTPEAIDTLIAMPTGELMLDVRRAGLRLRLTPAYG